MPLLIVFSPSYIQRVHHVIASLLRRTPHVPTAPRDEYYGYRLIEIATISSIADCIADYIFQDMVCSIWMRGNHSVFPVYRIVLESMCVHTCVHTIQMQIQLGESNLEFMIRAF